MLYLLEMKDLCIYFVLSVTKIKDVFHGLMSRLGTDKKRFSDRRTSAIEKRKKMTKIIILLYIYIYIYIYTHIYKIQGLRDNQKWCKIATMGILDCEKRETRTEYMFESIMTESFSFSTL